MQIIKKMIGFLTIILSLIIAFILINLLIGGLKFGSFSGYFQMLEDKEWQSVSSDITRNPVSRPKVFYENVDNSQVQIDSESEELLNNIDELLPSNTDSSELIEDELIDDLSVEPTFQTGLEDTSEIGQDGDNPYDPDFEDEFNSFFAGE